MIDSKKEFIDKQKKLPEETYSIGLYAGRSPFDLKPYEKATNPIMSRNEFSGRTTNFVADPFGIEVNGTWYLFFESMGIDTRIGKLSVSTSVDLCNWTVPKIVLDEPFHLSYPQVFKHNDSIYMLPETYQAAELRLYKAEEFPFKWKLWLEVRFFR